MQKVKENECQFKLIMIIDDTPEDLFITNRVLNKYAGNHTIISFNMATIALEYLQAHENTMEKIPDVIVSDLHMPQMNGFEFLDAFDKLPEAIKLKSRIVMLSSNLEATDMQKMMANPNVKRYYQKPISKEAIDELANDSICNNKKQ